MLLASESTIFREDINKDVSRTAQCNQGGVSKCRAVTVNSDFLVNQLRIGESVKFLPGINLSMKVSQASNILLFTFVYVTDTNNEGILGHCSRQI